MLARMASTTPPSEGSTLHGAVALATQVTEALPAGSPPTWRRLAFRAVLASILPVAVQGERPEYATSLSPFVREAAMVASSTGPEHRDDVFELVLDALLDDWVEDWDVSDDEDADG